MEKKNGVLFLSRKNNTGKYINSLLQKQKQKRFNNKCNLVFFVPLSNPVNANATRRCITAEATNQIADFLKVEFNQTLQNWIYTLSALDIPRVKIFDVFLAAHDIPENELSVETLKKQEYRRRIKIKQTAKTIFKKNIN